MRKGMKPRPMRERFEGKYCPEPNSGCWLWMGAIAGDTGYGSIRGDAGKAVNAHRASWLIHKGPVPDGQQVLHKCDIPSCVNPDHLFIGTQLDNVLDMCRKGRAAVMLGEKSSNAKLTEDDVRQILASPERTFQLARHFNVSPETIGGIRHGRRWKHIERRAP